MQLILKHFPPGERFSKKSELFYPKVYVQGQLSLTQIWGFGCWCFEVDEFYVQKEEAVGFKMTFRKGFSEYDFEPFDRTDSLNLMERWFTLHGMCLLKFKDQLSIAVENSQPLELIGLSKEDKQYYFSNLCHVFHVVVFNEGAFASHLHLSLSPVG